MSGFVSGATSQLEAFARNKRAAGALCRSYEDNLRRFDAWCAAEFPGAERLTQGMVDGWCSKRPTESANSCRSRCAVVVALVVFLRLRGETAVVPPELPRRQGTGYAPHAFTDDELSAFFAACDAWEPHRSTREALWQRTRLTPSVVFRLLWSSGIRTCEARLLTRDRADLAAGVLDIAAGKGGGRRVVALHPSMLPLMSEYDAAMEEFFPGRSYFFPNGTDGYVSRRLLNSWFQRLWKKVSSERATPYMLRHAYCIACIDGIVARGTEALEELEWVSKAMGHSSVDVTVRHYYHMSPSLARLLQERSDPGFDEVVPEAVRHD